MNRRKQNILRYCAMGLAAVLVTACVMLAAGTAFARYRTEYAENVSFAAQAAPELYLGRVDPQTGDFLYAETASWELKDGSLRLDFAVANGQVEAEVEGIDQSFHVRLIGGPAIQTGENPLTVRLMEPSGSSGDDAGYTAEVIPIDEASLLHQTFGDGWVYTFSDEQGQELSWTLEGGAFSFTELSVVIAVEEDTHIDPSLLQLQIIGRPAA